MDTAHTVLLGVIEGVTEFLPISSTGHLLIAEHWLGPRSELFNVGIQAGAMLAVIGVFWRRLLQLCNLRDAVSRDYVLKLILAFVVTMAGGLMVKKLGWSLPAQLMPVALALLIGGIAILGIEAMVARRSENAHVSRSAAFWVGACQILAAVFPGTSRSAATIFAAMLAGTTQRAAATEFAFLLGVPTMFAATGYEFLKIPKQDFAGEYWGDFGLGFVVSAVVAFISVKWLLRYVQSHRFTLFAWYRIIVGAALLVIARQS
jgi:undecaprenyl-diphosphatase